jgi:1,2-phenylacetyl-CoA epoxidase catalytic subunit
LDVGQTPQTDYPGMLPRRPDTEKDFATRSRVLLSLARRFCALSAYGLHARPGLTASSLLYTQDMPKSFSSWIAQLAPEARPELARALRRHAVRQVATLKASGAALAHAPTLDERASAVERAREELLHLEQASEVYRELSSGADLLQDAEQVAAQLPVPSSWAEASVAQLVLCLAARVDLDQHRHLAEPFKKLTERALAEETEHVHAARAALIELRASAGLGKGELDALLARWLPVALDSLDEAPTRELYLGALSREKQALGI